MMIDGAAATSDLLVIVASDQAQLSRLQEWLQAVPDVSVMRTAGRPSTGDLGVLDALTILAGSPALVAAIRVLPEFMRSRRRGFRLEVTLGETTVILEAEDAEGVARAVESLRNLIDDE